MEDKTFNGIGEVDIRNMKEWKNGDCLSIAGAPKEETLYYFDGKFYSFTEYNRLCRNQKIGRILKRKRDSW